MAGAIIAGALMALLVFAFGGGYCVAMRRIVRTAERNSETLLVLEYREFLSRKRHRTVLRQESQ